MVPFSRQMPTVIRPSQIGTDVTYEPPLRIGFGISDKTVEGSNATMGRTILPAGAKPNPTHYHSVNDVCWYILHGRIRAATAPTARKSSLKVATSSTSRVARST